MKPSEQLRELTTKWKSWIGSDTFENSMGCGNEGDVYSAGSNDFLRRNIPHLESLIPAVERLERWERALMDLTPGGSEFVGEPETCAKFVNDRLATAIRLQKRVMELEQGIRDAVQKL